MTKVEKQRLNDFNALGFEPNELAYLIEKYKLKNTRIKNIDFIPDQKPIKQIEIYGFKEFWGAYPKKVNKPRALAAFKRLKVDKALLEKILSVLEVQKGTAEWIKDSGAYIPHPASWLNGLRWEDEKPDDVKAIVLENDLTAQAFNDVPIFEVKE